MFWFSILISALVHSAVGQFNFGWTKKDACDGIKCLNKGFCTIVKKGFRTTYDCNCPKGYFGRTCEIMPCKGVVCKNDGYCTGGLDRWGKGEFSCNCPKKFLGDFCEIDRCRNQVCRNGGFCTTELRYHMFRKTYVYDCNCPRGYFGDNCEIDPCAGVQCHFGGECVAVSKSNYRCECRPGKFGKHCDVDPCDEMQCLNHGKCRAISEYSATCDCPESIYGEFCEIEPCADVTCLNGGFCSVVSQHTVDCNCMAGFLGDRCELAATRVNFRYRLGPNMHCKKCNSKFYSVPFPSDYKFPPQVISLNVVSERNTRARFEAEAVVVATPGMKVRVTRTDYDGNWNTSPTLHAYIYAIEKPAPCNMRNGWTDGYSEKQEGIFEERECVERCIYLRNINLGEVNSVMYDNRQCYCQTQASRFISDSSDTFACLLSSPVDYAVYMENKEYEAFIENSQSAKRVTNKTEIPNDLSMKRGGKSSEIKNTGEIESESISANISSSKIEFVESESTDIKIPENDSSESETAEITDDLAQTSHTLPSEAESANSVYLNKPNIYDWN